MSLVSITRVSTITPLAGLDNQVGVHLDDGYFSTIEPGEYEVGELVVRVAAGSWVPHDWAPWLIQNCEPRVSNYGIIGYHLKARDFRGWESNSIILKLKRFPLWDEQVRDTFKYVAEPGLEIPRLSKKNIVSFLRVPENQSLSFEDFLGLFSDMDENCNVYPYNAGTNRSIFEFVYNTASNHTIV